MEACAAATSSAPTSTKRKPYFKWSDEDRFLIGKHAIKNSTASAVRHFKKGFQKYGLRIQKESRKRNEEIETYRGCASKPRGRPLLLGAEIDAMVQRYILTESGAIISRAVTVSTTKALMKRYPNYTISQLVDIDSSSWAKILLQRMNFSRRRKTSSKVEIPCTAQKEIEFVFLHNIVSKKLKADNIPKSMIIN